MPVSLRKRFRQLSGALAGAADAGAVVVSPRVHGTSMADRAAASLEWTLPAA